MSSFKSIYWMKICNNALPNKSIIKNLYHKQFKMFNILDFKQYFNHLEIIKIKIIILTMEINIILNNQIYKDIKWTNNKINKEWINKYNLNKWINKFLNLWTNNILVLWTNNKIINKFLLNYLKQKMFSNTPNKSIIENLSNIEL